MWRNAIVAVMVASAAPQAVSRASDPYRFVIYALVVLMNFTLGITFLAPASLLPLITDEYGLSHSGGAFVVTSITLVFMAGSLPAAIIVSRWNIRAVYGIGWALMGCAVLTPFLGGFWALIGIRCVQGLGASALTPLTAAIIMRWAPAREVPIVNALTLATLTVGLGASLYIGPILAGRVGWEWAIGIEGLIAIVGAALWFVLWRKRPVEKTVAAEPITMTSIVSVLRRRETWLLAIAVIGPWAQFNTLSTFLPTYFQEVRGLSLQSAGILAAIFAFAGIPANILGGFIATITGRRRPILIWSGLFIGAAGMTTLYAPVGIILLIAIVTAGFLQWVYEPTLFTVPIELRGSSPERAGAIWAAILTTGNASSFVAPIVAGYIIDGTGSFILGIGSIAAFSFTMFFAALLLPETGPGRLNARP